MPRLKKVYFILSISLISFYPSTGFCIQEPTHKADTALINLLINQSRDQSRVDVTLADSLAEKALTLLQSVEYPTGLINCLIIQSNIKRLIGQLDEGFQKCQRAIALSEQINDPLLISESYNQLYLLYFQKADYDSATLAAKKSIEIAEEINYIQLIARGHQNFGILNSIKGNHTIAIEHFLQSEKYYHELGDVFAQAQVLSNLGVTFEEAGNLDQSLEYMYKSLAITREINDENLTGWLLTNIGSVYSQQNQLDSALYYYNQSLTIANAISNYDLIITNLDNIGSYYSGIKEHEKANFHLMSAYAMAEEKSFYYQNVYVTGHLAENYFAWGKLDSALFFAEKQLELAQEYEFKYDQKLAYSMLARIFASEKKYSAAYQALQNFVAINDSLFNEEKSQQIEELRERFEAEKRELEILTLQEKNEREEIKRNAYFIAGISIVIILLLLYNRQRLSSRKNRQLLEKEQEVEKMKSRFFSNISHELRTPLTLIIGPIESIKNEVTNPTTQVQLSIMQKNANRLLTLINQILDLSKLESNENKLLATSQDILPIIKGVAMSFASVAETKQIELKLEIEPAPLEVYFDTEKVETVIINLLSNAFKFTEVGGSITVGVHVEDTAYCTVYVQDTGVGIPKDDIKNIFNRFYQSAHEQVGITKGTGIGLALARELIELHHGTIEVQSAVNFGTKITLRLPLGRKHLTDGQIQEKPTIPRVIHNPFSNEITDAIDNQHTFDFTESYPIILLIEDNHDVRFYLKSVLQTEYNVLEAADGNEGIRMAIEHIPELIICDVMMPEKDGYEVCNCLKQDEKTNHIPIVLLTAKASQEDKIKGLHTMADDYLIKPVHPNELMVRVQNLISTRKQLREKFNRELILKPTEIKLNSIDESFLQRVTSSIEQNIDNDQFNVEQLGKEVGMSRSQIHRKLHALTNQSATQFIRSFRLARAMAMIQKNTGTISEIGYAVGFSNTSYFNKCFLEEFNCTPTEVRNKT